jgi:hypothetical protein
MFLLANQREDRPQRRPAQDQPGVVGRKAQRQDDGNQRQGNRQRVDLAAPSSFRCP